MPQQKGDVPPAYAQRLIAAVVNLKAAELERDAAITAALRAGGSTRQVGAVCGLSQSRVAQIGHEHGWPTARQKAAVDERRRSIAAWRRMIDDGLAALERETPDYGPE